MSKKFLIVFSIIIIATILGFFIYRFYNANNNSEYQAQKTSFEENNSNKIASQNTRN